MCIRDSSGTNEDGALSFSSTIVGAGGTDNLTITSGSGAISLGGTIGASTALDALTVNSSSALTISDSITTDGGLIDINAAVTLSGSNTISTGSGGGNIEFGSTVDNGNVLTLTSGSGNIVFSDNIGASNSLDQLRINESAGTGNVTLSGNLGTDSAPGVSSGLIIYNGSDGGEITLSGGIYYSGGYLNIKGTKFTFDGSNPELRSGSTGLTGQAIGITGTGDIYLATGSNLTIQAGEVTGGSTATTAQTINIQGSIIGPSSGTPVDVVIENKSTHASSTISPTYGSSKSIGTGINDVTLIATTVNLNGNITTVVNGSDKGDIVITGAANLDGDSVLDTSSSGGGITFSSTIDGGSNLDFFFEVIFNEELGRLNSGGFLITLLVVLFM